MLNTIIKGINEQASKELVKIDIIKKLYGGLSGAQVLAVEYGADRRLGVLKIQEENDWDICNECYEKAKANNISDYISRMIGGFEVKLEEKLYYVSLYELAGEDLYEIRTLMSILMNEYEISNSVLEGIGTFLYKWNQEYDKCSLNPLEIIKGCLKYRYMDDKMLSAFEEMGITADKRWIMLKGQDTFLPNPFCFLKDTEVWEGKVVSCLCSISHGDLNARNIIVSSSKPQFIDFSNAQRDTNIFYDSRYLEMHMFLDYLDFEKLEHRDFWIRFCEECSNSIDDIDIPGGKGASILRQVLPPIRYGINHIITDKRNRQYEPSFFLAGAAAGMNVLRKVRNPDAKMGAFIYAAYNLKAAIKHKLIDIYVPDIKSCIEIDWIMKTLETAKSEKDMKSNVSKKYNYRFLGMGSVIDENSANNLCRESINRIFLDVGNSIKKGIIDLHGLEDGFPSNGKIFKSTTGVVAACPNYILDNISDDAEAIDIVIHESPDIDCFAAVYLAQKLIETGQLPKGYEHLVQYVEDVDSGRLGLYKGYIYTPNTIACVIQENIINKNPTASEEMINSKTLARGLELIDYIMTRLSKLVGDQKNLYNNSILLSGCPFDEEYELLRNDYKRYKEDLEDYFVPDSNDQDGHSNLNVCEIMKLELPKINKTGLDLEKIDGLLWNRPPSCHLHKYWARQDKDADLGLGYTLTFIPFKPKTKNVDFYGECIVNSVIISVNPNNNVCLKGLAAYLEAAESEKEKSMFGDNRVNWRNRNIRRFDEAWCDNEDPWYDGRNFDYTIIASPRTGSLLTIKEMKNVLTNYLHDLKSQSYK